MRSTQRLRWLFTVSVLVFSIVLGRPSTANAQVETTSRISGTVTDPTGAVVPGASVTVRNEATGSTRQTTTDNGGSYSFPSLLPGTYSMKVTKEGFKTGEVTGRTIEAASPAVIDVTLPLGTTTQTVTISAAGAELLQTSTTELSGTVNPTLVTEIPLQRQNFFDLMVLTPGTVPQNLTFGISYTAYAFNFVQAGGTSTASGVFLAGNRDSASNVSIDGANVQSSVYQQATQLQSPADIQEAKVESHTMNAEFGSGVGAVNIITKSGSNQFHGEVYEFLRNNHLDATPFFTNLVGAKNPQYEENQFGGAAGGPIKKDKLFFFGNYEGFRVRQSSISLATVPPAGTHTGDLSSLGITIYNPYQYNAVTGQRTPFPGNKIPFGPSALCAPRASCNDPTTTAFMNQWILNPNTVVGGIPMLQGPVSTTLNSDQYTARIDFAQSSKSTIYGRFTSLNSPQFAGGIQPLEGTNDPYASKNAVLHWTYVLTPGMVNDFMVGYTRPLWQLSRNQSHGNVAQQLGLQNVGNLPGAPHWDVPGYDTDNANFYIIDGREDNYQLKDDLSLVRGPHTLKFGGEARNRRFYYLPISFDQGIFFFQNDFATICPAANGSCVAATGVNSRGGSPLADFVMGTTRANQLLLLPAPYAGYSTYFGFYGQDTWRATKKLTVNYGLRYENWTPWLVPRNTTVQFNETTGQVLYALQNPLDYLSAAACYGACGKLTPGVPRQAYRTSNHNFAPRLGLSYLVTPKTVVRAGAGIYYDGNTNTNQFHDPQTGAPPFSLRTQGFSALGQVPDEFVTGQFPPPPPTGILQPNLNPPTAFRAIQAYYPAASVYQWSFNVQRSLGSYWTAEADYDGSHTIHEYMFEDLNSAVSPVGAVANETLQQRRKFPQWGEIGSWIPIGYAKYGALTLTLKNREWHGLTWISNYTWAKNLTTSDTGYSDGSLTNLNCRYCITGPAEWTPAHQFVAGYNYTLPFGKGKSHASSLSPVVDKFVSGWAFSGITTFSTGSPQAAFASADLTGTALTYAFADRVPGCNPNSGAKTRFQWFNTNCLVQPPYATWPNATLGAVTYAGINSWDLTIIKTTMTGFPKETGRVELKGELFNAFNHTQWGGADTGVGDPTFGQVTSTRQPRVVQFALRYFF